MRRRRKVLIAAASVSLLLAAGVVLAAIRPTPASASAGTFVASVPWSSAVIGSADDRTLTVRADVQGMDDRFACGPTVRTHVVEHADEVTVRVDLLDRPLPVGVFCGGSGLGTVPATIRLRSALGDRALVDAVDGTAHAVLVVAATPAITRLPARFARKSTGWDEATGQVHEWWRWQHHGQAQQIDLDSGPTATAPAAGEPRGDATSATVGASRASVRRLVEGDTVSTTVAWSTRAGRTLRLTVNDQTRHPMSRSAVVDLARSVR